MKQISMVVRLLFSFFLLTTMSCDPDPDTVTIPNDEFRYFRMTVALENTTEVFIVRTNEPFVLELADSLLTLPKSERLLHVNGTIARGNNDYNLDWNWHFKDNEWSLVEISIELCDATPSYVEANLDYFIDTIGGNFCPWSSTLDREMMPGDEIR